MLSLFGSKHLLNRFKYHSEVVEVESLERTDSIEDVVGKITFTHRKTIPIFVLNAGVNNEWVRSFKAPQASLEGYVRFCLMNTGFWVELRADVEASASCIFCLDLAISEVLLDTDFAAGTSGGFWENEGKNMVPPIAIRLRRRDGLFVVAFFQITVEYADDSFFRSHQPGFLAKVQ